MKSVVVSARLRWSGREGDLAGESRKRRAGRHAKFLRACLRLYVCGGSGRCVSVLLRVWISPAVASKIRRDQWVDPTRSTIVRHLEGVGF